MGDEEVNDRQAVSYEIRQYGWWWDDKWDEYSDSYVSCDSYQNG